MPKPVTAAVTSVFVLLLPAGFDAYGRTAALLAFRCRYQYIDLHRAKLVRNRVAARIELEAPRGLKDMSLLLP